MKRYKKAGLLLGPCLVAAAPAAAQPIGRGAPVTTAPDDDPNLQYAASVGQVNALTHQGDLSPTLFSTVGDTAMNGVYLFLSFEMSSAEGSRVFRVGDVSDYRIISETRGRLLLAVTEEDPGRASVPVRRSRRVLISWTPGPGGTPPATVRVATAPTPRRR
jgi:hypothetical protein